MSKNYLLYLQDGHSKNNASNLSCCPEILVVDVDGMAVESEDFC